MSKITRYKNLEYLLQVSGLPPVKMQDFYIFNLDDVKDASVDLGSHSHNYFEISFNIGTDIEMFVGHKTENVSNDKIWFLTPNQLLNWENNNDALQEHHYFAILFKAELLPFTKGAYTMYKEFPFFNRNSQVIFQLNIEQRETIFDLFNKIHKEHKNFNKDSPQIIISYLTILLYTCKRELHVHQNINSKKSRAEEIALQFEHLAQQSSEGKKSIAYYANILHVSPVYLSECVKKIIGKTAKQIIDEYLIIEAKSVLKHSDKSITQIAMDLEFDDKSNFSKYFKKHTGFSPTEYQNT